MGTPPGLVTTSRSAFPLPPARPSAARADHSRFVQRIRRRYAAELALLPPGVPDRVAIAALIERLEAGGRGLPSALRVTRQLVLERLAVLDVEQHAPLDDVTLCMTELAEVTLERALEAARAEQDARYGVPRSDAGAPIDFWIVGMGKLGARELNVSSDIDLVYLYEESGTTDGGSDPAGPISAHEYFSQVARSLYALIGETTEDGFVFRVDLALRPNGNSGPPVTSLAMLEDYLQAHGREWERFAWLKSRVIAPRASVESGRAQPLRGLVTSFVYRRYLDYGVFEGLRQLHAKVRDEAQRRAAGRPERANDVKLSRGGIREIEFIVQLLLVVRGGQFPEIRTRSTMKALAKLAAGGLMSDATAARLADAYLLLRRIEHRIQYLDDQQTHRLPTEDGDLDWIAASLGFASSNSTGEMLDVLGAAREAVAAEFDALLGEGRSISNGKTCRTCVAPPPPIESEDFLETLPPILAARVQPLCRSPKVQLLRDESKLRLARLVMRAGDALAAERCTTDAALHFIDWLEPLLRRESYLALLAERPEVQSRLLRLLGLARWPMRYIMLHPGVIDELADERLLHSRFEAAAYTADLRARHAAWQRAGTVDEELLLDTLRRAHHAEVFRTLVRDVEGHITVEQVADDLSALADATLACALQWAWRHLRQAHRDEPQLAVLAYGKLGGKELGYGSDLDLVFVYDDPDTDPEKAAEVYGALVRKLIQWLTLRTSSGGLFDIDTALRPNGNSGLLVSSMDSFERYQAGRGSNTAWTWEHQALTRARWCAGHMELAPRFDEVRRQVLTAPRDPVALRNEVAAMREKVQRSHPVRRGTFDLKYSPGAMIDVEFAVQCLVLAESAAHPELLDDVGNIALLQRAEAAGLLPAGVGNAAADAYRELRRAQHRARLDEKSTQVDPAGFTAPRDAVLALWDAVFRPAQP
ncbi:bifunctional [glutamate--ammonia ligase]-adenylyl-L-tyrosine phosphorylase/[glutamate--ammonia-ligase] adenylyltransferase [Piscinibacter koreensis]|uniref:Bifunctional glutamine synthetase adenylyltransferase/adenylyl-removing enzyme n=1 Tax=Piscinibacter koreensis TaxID=2742824 RepID=A0A7Y6NK47_9BURK|nr:bifunctional [glutamate--ammonia ligase]-adenylyl-L-tyrosine phosphorylase/[glutamate--ammonia-ligase] adenylyltransferase [Schlegelella koreensis]NUZ04589.1 bifunctional [glutamate--ammonia ligase]-adenylyl-L-tyrosine phosphorylase/[glutamate--ammonia-ligase] adenylyltransferase [Schlegelella koreensis]